jgi:hypothetical protein
MDCITVSLQEFYNQHSTNVNQKVIDKIHSTPKHENTKFTTKSFTPKLVPKHLGEFRNINKCYKRELTGLLNKINENNFDKIVVKLFELITNENTEYVIKIVLNKSYTEHIYMHQMIRVLSYIKSTTYSGDVVFYISDFYNTFVDKIVNMLDDIEYLNSSTAYDDFCKCNKQKRNLINYGKCIIHLIKNEMLDIHFTEYYDLIFYKLCEHIENNVYTEILIEMTMQFFEIYNHQTSLDKFKKFHSSKSVSQRLSQKSIFRLKDIF